MQFLVTLDNHKDTVPPREEWRKLDGHDHRDACFQYCAEFVQGWGKFGVLVVSADHYERHGWAGACVHAFEVVRTEQRREVHAS